MMIIIEKIFLWCIDDDDIVVDVGDVIDDDVIVDVDEDSDVIGIIIGGSKNCQKFFKKWGVPPPLPLV